LFYLIALVDLIQLGLCLYTLQGIKTQKEDNITSTQKVSVRNSWGFIAAIGIVVLTFQLANNLVRPYLTTYVTQAVPFGVSLLHSSLIFMIPSVMAIAAMPFIRRFAKPSRLRLLYTIGLSLLIGSLYLQGFASQLSIFIISRIVYGFFLAITQAVLELKLFDNSNSKDLHFNYSLVISCANVGHLGAPLLASSLVSNYSLATPLIAAATLCILNLIFARTTIFRLAIPAVILQPSSSSPGR
jgi:DHA1 family multidrug resistance protein-like MFS transporter